MTLNSPSTDLDTAATTTPQPQDMIGETGATQTYITIHGHFYQPPRENPYIDAIERQPSAAPFHDWNERIAYECYRPNAFARIFNDSGDLVDLVNNYEYMSFNIGPTLMAWLDEHDHETYEKILEADRLSVARQGGHGNAIAQVYNHIIMPLANRRDKQTQVRWGIADFRKRFGRDPEGMWLAETAIDGETVEVLIEEGLRFVILAPSQVSLCRPFPTGDQPEPDWANVADGYIDPARPYRCFLDADRSRYLDVFFYDGPISGEMGFNDEILQGSKTFADRLALAVHHDDRPSQLISVATDGETFGHHKAGKEKCIAYCFRREFADRGWQVTNFGHYLSLHPPTWECILKDVTAWSCSHGVDRWQDDCGCGSGGGTQQRWRKPLRDSLNWLREELIAIYDKHAPEVLRDPWAARNDYIDVVLDRSQEMMYRFLAAHQVGELDVERRTDALHLLEMQRHSLLMFTSCGWFFEEISRPEGTQILRYAARAIELAGVVSGIDLEPEFVDRLAAAPTNDPGYSDGADLYHQAVTTAKVTWGQVAAHYAIASLFNAHPERHQVYCYEADRLDYQIQRFGTLALAIGQVRLTSEISRESQHLIFAALHLGGLDFHCCIQPFRDRLAYSQLKDSLFASLTAASTAQVILQMSQLFDGETFALNDLFAEEEYRIVQQLSRDTLTELDRLYTQVYRDNYSLIAAYRRADRDVPPELQVAAEVALRYRFNRAVADLNRSNMKRLSALDELGAIATEAERIDCLLNVPQACLDIEAFIEATIHKLLAPHTPEDFDSIDRPAYVRELSHLIEVCHRLELIIDLDPAQEYVFLALRDGRIPNITGYIVQLAKVLQIDVARASVGNEPVVAVSLAMKTVTDS